MSADPDLNAAFATWWAAHVRSLPHQDTGTACPPDVRAQRLARACQLLHAAADEVWLAQHADPDREWYRRWMVDLIEVRFRLQQQASYWQSRATTP